MLIRRPTDILPSEITSGDAYLHRREWLKQAASMGLIAGLPVLAACDAQAQGSRLAGVKANPAYAPADERINKVEDFRNYCNFYEFGTDKTDPPVMAKALKTRPWTVAVEGEVLKPKTFDIDDLMKLAPLEERIYRFRCVEAWSMVVPWIGFPLSALINQVQPKGNAKFVEFVTLADKAQMPGLRSSVLDWPYVEGLRLDEAMHPLTLLTFGAFGEVLAPQNGAPLRITIPWKYGFKGGKSIVKIRFVEKEPRTAWVKAGPSEYGFYSNVNPTVDHPRWSQATERRLGEFSKRKTLMFNGYADQVASLYTGMDLKKFY
ncbi:protein-methionine-sulfoxide reductase catalytic subunit MsrP [Casimicrobium huifangae]|jgi:sulfoxide reductase catalytic subunit YedY|uniref:protein-methionine-sulfoxide reductase catalytic subunit MsrP n=1 Tax=Casimicrobium huifangae TaxID=2591109 RepID=UPI001478D7E3